MLVMLWNLVFFYCDNLSYLKHSYLNNSQRKFENFEIERERERERVLAL